MPRRLPQTLDIRIRQGGPIIAKVVGRWKQLLGPFRNIARYIPHSPNQRGIRLEVSNDAIQRGHVLARDLLSIKCQPQRGG